MSKSIVNTFKKLDADTSQNKQDNESFYDAQNLRIISDEALSNGALVNFKGTKAKIDLGNSFTKLKGYAKVGNDLALLLYKDIESLTPDSVEHPDDRTISNYSVAYENSYEELENYERVYSGASGTLVGPGAPDINIGEVVRYNNSFGTPMLNLLPNKDYKINFTSALLLDYSNRKFTIIVGNSNCISGFKGKGLINKSDVLVKRDYVNPSFLTQDLMFTVPNSSVDFYIIVYPGEMVDIGTKYEFDINPLETSFIINSFQYKNTQNPSITSSDLISPFDWATETETPFARFNLSDEVYPFVDPLSGVSSFAVSVQVSNIYDIESMEIGLVDMDTGDLIQPISIITDEEDTFNGGGIDVNNGGIYDTSGASGATVGKVFAIFTFDPSDITVSSRFIMQSAGDIVSANILDFSVNLYNDVEYYRDLDMDYKSQYSPEMVSAITDYEASFYGTSKTTYSYTPDISGGMIGGFKYRMYLSGSSLNGSPVPFYIGVNTMSPIAYGFVQSGEDLVFDIDALSYPSTDIFNIYFDVFIGNELSLAIDTVTKIINLQEIYTIPSSGEYVSSLRVSSNSSADQTALIVIKNGATTVRTYNAQIVPSSSLGGSVVMNLSNMSGFKIYINISPNSNVETIYSLKDFYVNILSNSPEELYTFSGGKMYKHVSSVANNLSLSLVSRIVYKVVNISNGSVYFSKTVNSGSSSEMRLNIPDDGSTYKLFAETYVDQSTMISVLISDVSIFKYTLTGENSTGSIIAKVTPTETGEMQNISILYSDYFSVDKLGFDEVDEVQCVGKYEHELSGKIYFSVPGRPIRIFNIFNNVISTADASTLDILPNNIFTTLSIDSVISGGGLENGRVQYACKLFNKYGAETSFSSSSELVSLTPSSPQGDVEFTGGDIEKSSGKSVIVKINLQDSNSFNYIQIYSIHYKTNSTPVVSLIGELEITSDEMIFVDNGSVLDTVTIEEYNTFGGRLISAATIAEKNNILFAANTEELSESIDPLALDCRAYRFMDQGPGGFVSKVFQKDNSENPSFYIISPTGEWSYWRYNVDTYDMDAFGENWSIPIDADAINMYNDEFSRDEWVEQYPNKFDLTADGLNFGGTGKIISYKIKTSDSVEVMVDAEVIVDKDNIDHVIKSNTHKQGEVYRYGIVPFDLKGKPYFVQWIGDIRIPYFNDDDSLFRSEFSETYYIYDLKMSLKNVYIEFSIDKSQIPVDVLDKISGFRIVRAERTDSDKSIVAQGYTVGGAGYNNSLSGFGIYGAPRSRSDADSSSESNKGKYPYIHTLLSPDFNINGGKGLEPASYRAYITKIIVRSIAKASGSIEYQEANTYALNQSSCMIPATGTYDSPWFYSPASMSIDGFAVYRGRAIDVVDSVNVQVSSKNAPGIRMMANGDPVTVFNRIIRSNENQYHMNAPTGMLFTSNLPLPPRAFSSEGTTFSSGFMYIIDLYQDNASVRYGGDRYTGRINTQYKPASPFIHASEDVLVANGDSYNSLFDVLISAGDSNIVSGNIADSNFNSRQLVAILPIESSVNCFLTMSKSSKYYERYPGNVTVNADKVFLQESQVRGIEQYSGKYPTIGDLNKYNPVYSAIERYPTFLQRPAIFDEFVSEKFTISASQKKIINEYIDSWGKFLYSDILDVSSKYGPIVKLIDFKNSLYFMQEDAIGSAAVNDRYLINQGAAQLALGTGGILERYDYIKYNSGIIKPTHVINTGNGIYYIDSKRKTVEVLSESAASLSLSGGINSLFRDMYKDSGVYVAIGYDPKNKEVLFTIKNNNYSKTIVFNEIINAFGPRHSTTPDLYLNLSDEVMSYIYSNQDRVSINNYIYRHNAGLFGETYSEAGFIEDDVNIKPSYISFIVNTNTTTICVFDNIKFNTEVRLSGDDSYDIGPFGDIDNVEETFDEATFKNSYQSVTSSIRPFKIGQLPPNASRRIRGWSMAVPLTQNSKRFVDTFLSITFKYNNLGNKLFKLHDVSTFIRMANR